MARWTYDQALARLLAHEGGYTNHPADPGGPTNFGITIHDYRRYVKSGASAADVKAMTVEEAKSIYRTKYWDAQRCDELPAGVDYTVFDYGVNSGIGRSKKVLQRVVGVKADGVLGPETMRAVEAREPRAIIVGICDERLRFLKRLRTWPVFGKGWGRRVAQVKTVALAMAANAPASDVNAAVANGKAPKEPASISTTSAVAAIGSAAVVAAGHGAGLSWWEVALIALAAFIAGCVVIHFASKND